MEALSRQHCAVMPCAVAGFGVNYMRFGLKCLAWWLLAVVALPSGVIGQTKAVVTAEKVAAEKVDQPTARQRQWLAATPQERVRLAEALGEEGARKMARSKGYQTLYDGLKKTLPQGPDQVYQAADGRVVVYEAKGGSGQLGHAYGYPQGSPEWAVESAKRVLHSAKARPAERAAAQKILEAAAEGRLEVHVIRTRHILGVPTVAVLEQAAKSSDKVSRVAREALDELSRSVAGVVDDVSRTAQVADDALRSADDVARASANTSSAVLKTVSTVAVPVALTVDTGVRVSDALKTEQKFAAGKISIQQREVTHAQNAAGMFGGWAGAWAGAEAGTAAGGLAGSAVAPGLGTAIGGAVGGITGGIAGYFCGEHAAKAAAEWSMNKIHATGTTIVGSTQRAWTSTTNAAKSVGNGVSQAWNWVRGK